MQFKDCGRPKNRSITLLCRKCTNVIVHDKHFENAVAKLQAPSHIDANLTPSEKEAAADEEEEAKSDIPQMGYAERKLREDADRLHQKKQKRSEYRSVAHVTNNRVIELNDFPAERNLI